ERRDPVDVGMDVDEARRGDETVGVDDRAAPLTVADRCDPVALDDDVADARRSAAPVDDRRPGERPGAQTASAPSATASDACRPRSPIARSTIARSSASIASEQTTSSPRASGA